jgi:Flp pilus assembly protein TadD
MVSEGATTGITPASAVPIARSRTRLAWCTALILLAVVAYANAAFHPFVYDDLPLVLKNPEIRSLDNLGRIVGVTSEGFMPRTRWTRSASHALEYALVGTWAPLYHMTNIALHAGVALLVFALIGRLAQNVTLAGWTAALFVVHPLNTEVVAHVSGRRDLLAALFSLGTLLLLERYVRAGGAWRVGAALGSLYLAVFSKELAVMTPFVFMALDTWTASRAPGAPSRGWFVRHLRQRAVLYGGLAACGACLASAVLFLSPDVTLAGSPGIYDTHAGGLGAFERATLAGGGLRLLAVPLGQSVDYSYDALRFVEGASLGALVDLGVFLAAVGVGAWGLWRRNLVGLAVLWGGLYYLPHAGVIAWHEVFAERFLYFPSIGFALACAAAGTAHSWRRAATAVGVVALVGLTLATVARNEVWGSSLALWQSAVERYPNCARAHKALADAWLAETRADLAIEHYRRATEILPTYLDAHTGIAIAQTARREYTLALATLDRVLERWPDDAKALNAKAYVHETLGDFAAAMDAYQRAIESDPALAEGYNNLGRLYVEQGDLDQAIRMYELALERNPAMVRALDNLALVYREGLGDAETAARYEAEAKRLRSP